MYNQPPQEAPHNGQPNNAHTPQNAAHNYYAGHYDSFPGFTSNTQNHWPGIFDIFGATPAGELPNELETAQSVLAGQNEPQTEQQFITSTEQTNTANTQLTPPFSGDITAPQSTAQDFTDVLREARAGMPQYDLSNAELSAALPSSGIVPRAAQRITPQGIQGSTQTRVDPDGGLTQYRAEGDDSPVTWRNSSGRPMRTSDGQLFTQKIYDDWRQKADAGYFKDRGINNAEDLNKWLNNIGMRPDRPSEQRGVNNLNGNSQANANLPPETEDTNITPFNITPSNSPEQFQAPQFTDEINDTTPDATQGLLDGLNGITDRRYRQLTEALKQYPSTNSFAGAGNNYRILRQDGDFLPPANQQSNDDMYKRRAEILKRYPQAPETAPEVTRFPSHTPTRTTQSAPQRARKYLET